MSVNKEILTSNSKKRVENIFNGEMPDRPAVGFFAIDSDTAQAVLGRETYWRAKAKCQIAFWEGRRDEVVQSWIEDGIELYEKLDFIDIIPVCCEGAGLCPPVDYSADCPKKIEDNTWADGEGRVYKYSPVTKDITLIQDGSFCVGNFDLEKELWDGELLKPNESIFEVVDAFLERFSGDRFVLGPSAKELAWYLPGGMENGLMELAMKPSDVKKVYESLVAEANQLDKFYVRPGQSGVLWGTDIAFQSGPMISPEMYKDFFFDGFKQRVANVKGLGQKVIKHMCGNNWLLLDMMAQSGIDCYQSVQETAGMDIMEVHRKYSESFVVWGGVVVEKLVGGTMQEVRDDVKRVMTELAPKGRFIFGTSHSVAVGTKYDNFMAMIDELHKYL